VKQRETDGRGWRKGWTLKTLKEGVTNVAEAIKHRGGKREGGTKKLSNGVKMGVGTEEIVGAERGKISRRKRSRKGYGKGWREKWQGVGAIKTKW